MKTITTAALLSIALFCLGFSVNASAKQVHSLSQATANQLKDAQDDMADKKWSDALETLHKVQKSVKDDDYATALTEQLIAYVYIGQKQYSKAFPHLKKAVDLHALPDQMQHDLMLTMAQLYASKSEFKKVIKLLTKWFKTEKNPPASAYVLAATSYYSLDHYTKARHYIKLALKTGDEPKKQWYSLLIGVDYKLKHYKEAISTIKDALAYWPNEKRYWRNLYGIYLLRNQNAKALRAMRIAYTKGAIDSGADLLNLARLEISHEMPYYAGLVVSKGLKSGKIKSTSDNWGLLVSAWVQAEEMKKAIKALDTAAKLSKDGERYLKQARLCYGVARWSCTVKAAGKAVKKGSLDEPGKAYILKGMALVQQKHYSLAKASFDKASKYDKSKKSAKNWITYVNNLVKATSS